MTTRNPIGGLDALADGWEPTSPRPKVQEGPVGPQTPPTVPPMNFTTTLHLIQVNDAAPSTPPESAANAPEAQHAAVAIMDMGRSLSVLDGMDTSGRLPEPNRPGLMPCVAMLFAVRRFSRGGFPCAQVFQFQIMDMARRFMEALGGSADGVAA